MDDKQRFIDDPEKAFEFLKEVSINARFVIDKIWENAKFFTTITSAILTFSVAAILTFIKDKPALISKPIVIFLVHPTKAYFVL